MARCVNNPGPGSLSNDCWFYMYFIKKCFPVFLLIDQFAKNGVNCISTFMYFH